MTDWTLYSNFDRSEFECRCGCGAADMDAGFMRRLQDLRTAFGKPMQITSGFRCAGHNRAVGGGPAHAMGRAADIGVRGAEAFQVASMASESGFTGIGVQQKGGGRFIHLDDLPNGTVPRPWIWSY